MEWNNCTLNPYQRVEAETMAYSEGVKATGMSLWKRDAVTKKRKKTGEIIYITSIHNGDFIKVQGVDFSEGSSSIDLRVAVLSPTTIEIRMDKKDGRMIGKVDLANSGEGDIWKTVTAPVKNIKGVHDLYFVFKGDKELLNFDWWKFTR